MKVSHDSETLAVGQQVITACAFISDTFGDMRRVFLAKRSDAKKFMPGIYELPGGHIDYGEDIVEGLKREIMEELGMRVEIGEPFFVFTYINEIKGSHSIEVVYFAHFLDQLANITINPEDHSGFVWFAEDQLPEVVAANREQEDDPEMRAMRKGFEILKRSGA